MCRIRLAIKATIILTVMWTSLSPFFLLPLLSELKAQKARSETTPGKVFTLSDDVMMQTPDGCMKAEQVMGESPTDARIPQRIWQTWRTRDLPLDYERQWNTTLQENPGWQRTVVLDDEADAFIRSEWCGDVVRAWDMLNMPVPKADFWRYHVLYKYGGIYLDADKYLTGKLNDLIGNHSAVVSFKDAGANSGTNKFDLMQDVLVFKAGHPILMRAIRRVIDNIFYNKYPDYIGMMTGPSVFAHSVQEVHPTAPGMGATELPQAPRLLLDGGVRTLLMQEQFGNQSKSFPGKVRTLYKTREGYSGYYAQALHEGKHVLKGNPFINFLRAVVHNPIFVLHHFRPRWLHRFGDGGFMAGDNTKE